MYTPDLPTFKKLAQGANLVPVYREISADLETPVSAYLKIARPGPGKQGYSFLLESVEGGENLARYSFIGAHPSHVIRTGPGQKDGETDPLTLLRDRFAHIRHASLPGLPRFHGGAVGYISYDAIRYFEPRVPPLKGKGVGVPEAIFLFTDALLIFDHVRHTITVLSHAHIPAGGDAEAAYKQAAETIEDLVRRLDGPLPPGAQRRAPARDGAVVAAQAAMDYAGPSEPGTRTSRAVKGQPIVPNMRKEQYVDMIETGKRDIFEGEVIQVVLSQRLSRRTDVRPFDLYRSLRAINPSPYMFFLDLEDFQIVGASPELLVQVIDGQVAVHPIAGTRRRGATPEEDAALAKELASDEKERAEHVMLLDLGRNDVGRVAVPGTVKVTQQMDIER